MDIGLKDQLELQIGAIGRDCQAPRSAPPPEPEKRAEAPIAAPVEEPFGRWLLVQRDRGDWVDSLADAARADRGFPRNGSPEDVRERLQQLGADGDAFEQVDDAERHWRS